MNPATLAAPAAPVIPATAAIAAAPAAVPGPHVVAADGRVLASLFLTWDSASGMLVCPFRGIRWPTVSQRAAVWDDSAQVLGQAGLHGVCHRPEAQTMLESDVVAHTACSGRIVFSPRALRAEEMELVGLTVVERTLAAPLWRRYGVPVRVMRPVRACPPGRSLRVVLLRGDLTVEICRYRGGRRHGTCRERWADGTDIISRYQDGQVHGTRMERLADGTVIIGRYRHDRPHGWCVECGADGSLITRHHRDGQPHGTWEECRADGTVFIRQFRDGWPDGIWEERRADGTVLVEHYCHGKRLEHYCHGKRLWPPRIGDAP